MILILSQKDSRAIGPRESSPERFLRLPCPTLSCDWRDIPDGIRPDLVLCTGEIPAGFSLRSLQSFGCPVFGWGLSLPDGPAREQHEEFPEDLFQRLTFAVPISGRDWAADPTCLSAVFDPSYEIEHDAVFFTASTAPSHNPQLWQHLRPRLDHTTGSLADAVEFLASGRVVVTDDWHAAYWAALLHRQVVVQPRTPRLLEHGLFQAAVCAKPADWQSQAGDIPLSPLTLLHECRQSCRQFHQTLLQALQTAGKFRRASRGTSRPKSELPAGPVSDTDVERDVQFLVKSFRRFDSLRLLVESIRRYYPEAGILIADDSFEEVPEQLPGDADAVRRMSGVEWVQLPFDTGLAGGRNVIVEKSTAPFLVLCDDDLIFTGETRIERMLQILQDAPDIDLVGGLLRQPDGVVQNWCGQMLLCGERPQRTLQTFPLDSPWKQAGGVWYRHTDLVFNFFAARRELLQKVPWDSRLKICGEHFDHLLALKQAGARLAFTPEVIALHALSRPDGYAEYRGRGRFFELLQTKWGLSARPRNLPVTEPCVPRRDPELLRFREAAGRPNILLFGVGHSGTSVVTRMLHAMGWSAGDADRQYAESVAVRLVNETVLRGTFDEDAAAQALEQLPQPWALKDPRFLHTLDYWIPLFQKYEPVLIWLVREAAAVTASYARRGERMRWNLTAESAEELARKRFFRWPWGKVRVDFESLAAAVACWRPGGHGGEGHGVDDMISVITEAGNE